MDINGTPSLEESKRICAMKGHAPIEQVVGAMQVLYDELRRLENERDAHLENR